MKRMTMTVDMANGDQFEVVSTTRDFVAFDETGKRQKPPWGPMQDNIARWEAFIAWHALRRVGKYTAPWEKFLDDCANVDGSVDEADPSLRGLGGAG